MTALGQLKKIAIHGAPRSGTTWLGEIFNSSPETIYKFQPLFSYAFKDYLNPGSSKEEIARFFTLLASKPDDFLDQVKQRQQGQLPNFEKAGPTHIVYKEVRYHHILENLVRKTDELWLIGIIRNPLSVIHSWLSSPREFRTDLGWVKAKEWSSAPSKNQNRPEEFFGFEKWKEVAQILLSLESHYPSRVKVITYQDLLRDPAGVVRDLFQFTELGLSQQTLRFLKESREYTRAGSYSVFKNGDTSKKWKDNLDKTIVNAIRKDLEGSKLERFLTNG